MKHATNFDIRLHRNIVLELLRPGEDGKSLVDKHNLNIMCKEYGQDDDWVGLSTDDYEMMMEDKLPYDWKTFELDFTGLQSIPIEVVKLLDTVNEDRMHIYDYPISNLPPYFAFAIARCYHHTFEDTTIAREHIYRIDKFNPESEEDFPKEWEEFRTTCISLYELANANDCAYIRFTRG